MDFTWIFNNIDPERSISREVLRQKILAGSSSWTCDPLLLFALEMIGFHGAAVAVLNLNRFTLKKNMSVLRIVRNHDFFHDAFFRFCQRKAKKAFRPSCEHRVSLWHWWSLRQVAGSMLSGFKPPTHWRDWYITKHSNICHLVKGPRNKIRAYNNTKPASSPKGEFSLQKLTHHPASWVNIHCLLVNTQQVSTHPCIRVPSIF